MSALLPLVVAPWQALWGHLRALAAFLGLPHLQDPLWLAAWGQFFTLLVTASGLIFVYVQIRSLAREHKLATNAATSQLYAEVSAAMSRLNAVFNERPALIPYLYENKPAPPVGRAPSVRRRLDNVCESVLDMVDAVVEQRRSLPADVSMDWSTWDAYFRYMFANSPVLQEYVDNNADFYPDYLFAALGHIVVREAATGRVLSRWNVRELAPAEAAAEIPGIGSVASIIDPASLPEPGFPFLRTWLIERKQSATAPTPATAALVAAVKGVSPVEATVAVRWLSAPGQAVVSDRELAVLQHWIIGTMHGTGIKRIAFDLQNGRRAAYTFREPTVRNGTRSFLVPEYPIRDRVFRPWPRRGLPAEPPRQPKGAGAPGAVL